MRNKVTEIEQRRVSEQTRDLTEKEDVVRSTKELEGALALYLIGMEVANADGDIDNQEFSTLVAVAAHASKACESKFVRDSAAILAKYGDPSVRPNPLKAHYEADGRNHREILASTAGILGALGDADRMRFLETARQIVLEVANASGGSWFNSDKTSDSEASIGLASFVVLSDGMYPLECENWIKVHGY